MCVCLAGGLLALRSNHVPEPCVSMCVHMCLCSVHMFLHVYRILCMCLGLCACMLVHWRTCICVHMCLSLYVHAAYVCESACLWMCTVYVCMDICMCLYVCPLERHVYAYVCVAESVHKCMSTSSVCEHTHK